VGEILDQLDLKGRNDELVKELVELAMRHGILTPYTSFMADENVNIRDISKNSGTAGERLKALSSNSGGYDGVTQRAAKGKMQNQLYYSSGALTKNEPPRELSENLSVVAGNTTGSYAISGKPGTMQDKSGEVAKELNSVQTNMRNVGNRTFYQRKGRWMDSQLTEAQEKNAQKIKQFSDEYFKLARDNGRELAQYLVFEEPVMIVFNNQAYLIEP
jgi:Ca-activated chloride channel homolog